jgi:hypothetical protein
MISGVVLSTKGLVEGIPKKIANMVAMTVQMRQKYLLKNDFFHP